MIFKNKANTEFNLDDEILYYYKFPEGGVYKGNSGVVKFKVKRIYINKEISDDGERVLERYEGASIGCNYYGIADASKCARTMTELTEKLLKQGFSLNKLGENND